MDVTVMGVQNEVDFQKSASFFLFNNEFIMRQEGILWKEKTIF